MSLARMSKHGAVPDYQKHAASELCVVVSTAAFVKLYRM